MNNNIILNVGYPRNPEDDPVFEGDAVNVKALYDLLQNIHRIFLKTDRTSQ